MWTRTFWRQTLERAIKSVAQVVLLLWLVADELLNAWEIDWHEATGFMVGAFVLSVATSIVSVPFGPGNSPSTVD